MTRRRFGFAAIAMLAATAVLRADSPLTSTNLASAYDDLPAVREALAGKRITPAVMTFLAGAAPNDQKAAVVNALGWQSTGNALAFLNGLAAARRVSPADLTIERLTPSDLFVYGYLLALETYTSPDSLRPGELDLWGATPTRVLYHATRALPDDFAVHLVSALVEAQHLMLADSKCAMYRATARVFEKFPPHRRNLRLTAIGSVQSYMDLYKGYCAAAPR